MFLQIIKLKSNRPQDELMEIAKERSPQFQAIPGLIQKYYAKLDDESGYAGVYVWDSKESLQQFRSSELAASIPKAYGLTEAPSVELMDIIFQLRGN